MDDDKLISVRCPAIVVNKKTGEQMKCNKLCLRVFPGSSGEICCRGCHRKFRFYVDSQAKSVLSVKAQMVLN